MNKKIVFIEVVTIFFIILFLYAAISKLIDRDLFSEQLNDIPIVSGFAPLILWGVPILEIGVSIVLFVPRLKRKGLLAASIIMAVFSLYVALLLAIDTHLPCSCGGIISDLSWPQHLIFNIICLGLAVTAFFKYPGKPHHLHKIKENK